MDKVTDSSNSVVQERYITLSVHRKSIEEARTFFDRVTAESGHRRRMGMASCTDLGRTKPSRSCFSVFCRVLIKFQSLLCRRVFQSRSVQIFRPEHQSCCPGRTTIWTVTGPNTTPCSWTR